MKMSSRERMIAEAERFAAGCSRSRLELKLVDEIRKLERENAYLANALVQIQTSGKVNG